MTPHYYTTLADFSAVFAEGLPVLTYHKLGPRPGRVRIKGLYVSNGLFRRQLEEWTDAGFRSGSVDETGRTEGNPGKKVVLTFDDGFENVLRHGLDPMRSRGFTAIQFLVADLIGKSNEWEQCEGETREPLMDAGQVREWLAAGHEIGAHSCTHPHLTQVPIAQAREEIFSSRRKLEDVYGIPIRHFCYPYGDWNPVVRDLVAEAGYETAVTTEAGVNPAGSDRLALKRYTVRYASRNWGNIGRALRQWLGRVRG